MDSEKFLLARKKLGKTQKQLAELLGTSLKAVHSYEQGWRSVPAHVERQLFSWSRRKGGTRKDESLAGLSKNVLLIARKSVRPGSSRPEGCAGLLTALFVKAWFKRIGTQR